MDMNKKYEFIVNAYGELMTLINKDYEYELVNDSYCNTFGKKREDFIGKTVWDVWGKEKFEKELKHKLDIGFSGEIFKEEDSFIIAGGERKHYEVTYYPYKNEMNEITHIVSVTNDITSIKTINEQLRNEIIDRKQAQEELNKYKNQLEDLVKARTHELYVSRKKYRDLAELLPETIFEMDVSGTINFINNRGLEKFGYSKKEFEKGLNSFQLIQEKEVSIAKKRFETFLNGEGFRPYEYTFITKDKKLFPGIVYMNKVSEGKNSNTLRGIIIDITDQKNIERKILNTVIETEEKERKRVAEDLHDGLGSLLSSLSIYIDIIDDDKLETKEKQKHLDYIRNLINEAILSSKEIANNLRPSTLSRFGLATSLKSFCEKINETKKIKIDFNSDEFDSIENQVEIAIFRITNELINNTLKYASADNIVIDIVNKNNTLVLKYKDDGLGFDKNEAMQKDGSGLQNIITRIDSINGKVEIESKKNEGIFVCIKVDLK
jgi:PAS domain S-box-containing protein